MTSRVPFLVLLFAVVTDGAPAQQPPKPTDAASAAVNASLARQPKRKKAPMLSAGKADAVRDARAVAPAGRVALPQRSAAAGKPVKR